MRPAEDPRTGECLEAAHGPQSPFEVLVVPLDPLLDQLPRLMRDRRARSRKARRNRRVPQNLPVVIRPSRSTTFALCLARGFIVVG